MQLREMTVAVTGGAGFIGSHLVDKLVDRGNKVVVFDNFATGRRENLSRHLAVPAKKRQVEIIKGDVCKLGQIEKALKKVDVVFHLATNCVRLSLTDPATNHEVNGTGTLNALMAAKKTGVKRFVYCSSSEVYGNAVENLLRGSGGLLAEDSPKLPTTVYGASKLVGEHYALAYHQTYGLPSMVVRPFNAYGPRSLMDGPYGEVIPRFALWIKAGMPPVIFGDGSQTRDFTYVEDTAAGLVAAAESDELLGDSVNLAHGQEVTVRDIARMLCTLAGADFTPKHIDDRPGDIRRLGCDTTKADRLLKDHFKVEIRDGLGRYLRWLDQQGIPYRTHAKKLTERNWELKAKGGRTASARA